MASGRGQDRASVLRRRGPRTRRPPTHHRRAAGKKVAHGRLRNAGEERDNSGILFTTFGASLVQDALIKGFFGHVNDLLGPFDRTVGLLLEKLKLRWRLLVRL